jgi:hypothetical protein
MSRQESIHSQIAQPSTSTGIAPDDRMRIRRGWLVVELVLIAALVVILNVFSNRVDLVLSPEDLEFFIPLLNLWLGMVLVLKSVILLQGRWSELTRWADIGLSVLGVMVLFWLLAGAQGGDVSSALAARNSTPQMLMGVEVSGMTGSQVLIKVVLVSALMVQLVGLGNKLYRILGVQTWKGVLLALLCTSLILASFTVWSQPIILGIAVGIFIGLFLRDAIDQRIDEDGTNVHNRPAKKI